MPENLSEEIVKDGAQNVTQKDIQKVISRSEELQRKFSARGPLARLSLIHISEPTSTRRVWSEIYSSAPNQLDGN